MNETKIKIIGVLGLIIICLLAVMYNAERIQDDILSRSIKPSGKSDFEKATPSVNGSDVTIEGVVKTKEENQPAENEVDNLIGVSNANNNLDIKTETKEASTPKNLPEEDERVNILSELSKKILFQPDNAILDSSSFETLDYIARLLNEYDDLKIEIAGHTDPTGEEKLNEELSQARAQAVKNYLITKSVNAERMSPIGFGSSLPIADNSTPEGRMTNRRVEFKLIKEK